VRAVSSSVLATRLDGQSTQAVGDEHDDLGGFGSWSWRISSCIDMERFL